MNDSVFQSRPWIFSLVGREKFPLRNPAGRGRANGRTKKKRITVPFHCLWFEGSDDHCKLQRAVVGEWAVCSVSVYAGYLSSPIPPLYPNRFPPLPSSHRPPSIQE